MLLFSLCSFGVAMAVWLLWLILLSLLHRPVPESDSLARLVRLQLGRVDGWPQPVKAALPLVVIAGAWWVLSWPLAQWAIVPRPASELQRLEQGLVIGLGGYLAWKHLIVAVLILHVLSSYVYFGSHAFWNGVHELARPLLRPLRRVPLRIGKVDFAPVVVIALVMLLSRLLESGLTALYARLPA